MNINKSYKHIVLVAVLLILSGCTQDQPGLLGGVDETTLDGIEVKEEEPIEEAIEEKVTDEENTSLGKKDEPAYIMADENRTDNSLQGIIEDMDLVYKGISAYDPIDLETFNEGEFQYIDFNLDGRNDLIVSLKDESGLVAESYFVLSKIDAIQVLSTKPWDVDNTFSLSDYEGVIVKRNSEIYYIIAYTYSEDYRQRKPLKYIKLSYIHGQYVVEDTTDAWLSEDPWGYGYSIDANRNMYVTYKDSDLEVLVSYNFKVWGGHGTAFDYTKIYYTNSKPFHYEGVSYETFYYDMVTHNNVLVGPGKYIQDISDEMYLHYVILDQGTEDQPIYVLYDNQGNQVCALGNTLEENLINQIERCID